MDDKTKELLAESLTSEDTEIIPYLTYLLQDLWELGSSHTVMKQLLTGRVSVTPDTSVLDLACGKGPVAVRFAEEYGCHVLGIDILEGFIQYARAKAEEYGVSDLCEFRVGDVITTIDEYWDYDITIWGAAGNLLGDYPTMLTKLSATVKPGGIILFDDAYERDATGEHSFWSQDRYPSFEEWMELFESAGLTLLAYDDSETDEDNDEDEQSGWIIARAEELKQRYPEKAELFDGYVKSQLAEWEDLDSTIAGVTWMLQVKA